MQSLFPSISHNSGGAVGVTFFHSLIFPPFFSYFLHAFWFLPFRRVARVKVPVSLPPEKAAVTAHSSIPFARIVHSDVLAWLWPGFSWPWLCFFQARAKVHGLGLALAWLGSSHGLCQKYDYMRRSE